MLVFLCLLEGLKPGEVVESSTWIFHARRWWMHAVQVLHYLHIPPWQFVVCPTPVWPHSHSHFFNIRSRSSSEGLELTACTSSLRFQSDIQIYCSLLDTHLLPAPTSHVLYTSLPCLGARMASDFNFPSVAWKASKCTFILPRSKGQGGEALTITYTPGLA